MNHLRLKSAVDKYSPQTFEALDDLKSALYSDEKQYAPDEIAEIIESLSKIQKASGIAQRENDGSLTLTDDKTGQKLNIKPKLPNDNLDLSGFDYTKFGDMSVNELNEPIIDPKSKESFAAYLKLVNGLNGFENRDFVQYMASGVFQRVMNANMEPVFVLVGLKINKSDPVNVTRIPVNMARNLNAQIMDRNNPASNSRYFLLKKPS